MSKLSALFMIGAIAALSTSLPASAADDRLCWQGCPISSASDNIRVDRAIYSLSVNPATKFADWASYVVTPDSIGRTAKRVWRSDPAVPADAQLEPDDYRGAFARLHTDRGHQVPLASFTNTPFWEETNYLTNITPQKSDLNQGSWMHLENAVRALAFQVGAAWVVTGPLYEQGEEMMQLPGADEPHVVPTGYFKVVALNDGRMTAFIFDQDVPRSFAYCDARVTVEDVERRTGLDLFPAAPASAAHSNIDREIGCQ